MIVDQSREKEQSPYGEFVRLYNELLPKPEQIINQKLLQNGILEDVQTVIPAKEGIDIINDSIEKIRAYIPQSKAQEDFIVLAVKMRSKEIPEDAEKLGEAGIFPTMRKKLTDNDLKTINTR